MLYFLYQSLHSFIICEHKVFLENYFSKTIILSVACFSTICVGNIRIILKLFSFEFLKLILLFLESLCLLGSDVSLLWHPRFLWRCKWLFCLLFIFVLIGITHHERRRRRIKWKMSTEISLSLSLSSCKRLILGMGFTIKSPPPAYACVSFKLMRNYINLSSFKDFWSSCFPSQEHTQIHLTFELME